MPKRSAAAVDLVQPKGALNAYMFFATDPDTKTTAKDELPVGHTVRGRDGEGGKEEGEGGHGSDCVR